MREQGSGIRGREDRLKVDRLKAEGTEVGTAIRDQGSGVGKIGRKNRGAGGDDCIETGSREEF